MIKNRKNSIHTRPISLSYPKRPERPDKITFDIPTGVTQQDIEEIILVDGLTTSDELVKNAVRAYLTARKNAPTFDKELAEARQRLDDQMQVELIDPDAPKDII